MFSVIRTLTRKIIEGQRRRIALLGMTKSGKTSFLNCLLDVYPLTNGKTNKKFSLDIKVGQNAVQLLIDSVKLNIIDPKGTSKGQNSWIHLYDKVDGIIFLIDCQDTEENIVLAGKKLKLLLNLPELQGCCFSVCCNKCENDKKFISPSMFFNLIDFDPSDYGNHVSVFATSTLEENSVGIENSISWMMEQLLNNQICLERNSRLNEENDD
eukprot:TRINITY_DN8116_c0_g1_i1.p1 TRINITY_DN8116_c0_g1~~TRINITY_DN8116_c0_g1_i1.p1  ORF type:complete len:211 (-),score=66.10 TRINITY_DN8116_c0_g1_i1:17-649(-)